MKDKELVFKECLQHIEHLPDAVAMMQATATLDGASQGWITGKLGQTHYAAYVHQVYSTLIPGLGTWTGGCNGGSTILCLHTLLPWDERIKKSMRTDIVERAYTTTEPEGRMDSQKLAAFCLCDDMLSKK